MSDRFDPLEGTDGIGRMARLEAPGGYDLDEELSLWWRYWGRWPRADLIVGITFGTLSLLVAAWRRALFEGLGTVVRESSRS